MDRNYDNILLSICIPTKNRSNYLKDSILSIAGQCIFQETNNVEIIISDNCSDDETSKICSSFVEAYGKKIRYYRNEYDIEDRNFEKALSYGDGLFLKLSNDTLIYHEGSLEKMVQVINENKSKKNVLFFSDGLLNIKGDITCIDLDSFVESVSYWSGWIGSFGIWREDFSTLVNFNRRSHLQLTQVDVLFRLINSQREVFVNNDKLFSAQPVSKKGGYDLLTVFLDNYVFLLTEQLNNKKLSKKVFVVEKRKLLLQFIRPWLVSIKIYPNKFYFGNKNWVRRIVPYYKTDVFTLIRFIIHFNLSLCYHLVRKIVHYPLVQVEK